MVYIFALHALQSFAVKCHFDLKDSFSFHVSQVQAQREGRQREVEADRAHHRFWHLDQGRLQPYMFVHWNLAVVTNSQFIPVFSQCTLSNNIATIREKTRFRLKVVLLMKGVWSLCGPLSKQFQPILHSFLMDEPWSNFQADLFDKF